MILGSSILGLFLISTDPGIANVAAGRTYLYLGVLNTGTLAAGGSRIVNNGAGNFAAY